ncbi:PilZ domain-containing protein [Trichlorobacter ammonificans]|uniref:Type IV pilus assembly PilZ n=1 Tax=Trichlorobacter ammonificans TaxID=2916410 RepID=A0ABM9DAA4_9BACT|nr:PilZ domain-containing protein [Trichlorobacter ammonificans]CAH2032086.1 Type IV pilus assembly PilZ [Trichlorobacter ammonificans]
MSTRKFSRVGFHVMATVSSGGRSFQGRVSNLSMNGMLLETEEQLPMGEVVDITISLPGTEPEITVAFTGRVCRLTEGDIAFRFEMIDLDSYTHLRNIVSYNMADAEKVMDEIFADIDEKIAAGATARVDAPERP